MGVQLTSLIAEPRNVDLSALLGKKVAVDAFNWIYQFLSTIRQPDGTPLQDSNGNVTSHLSGLFYRNAKLLQAGIEPVYVFDGKRPEMKAKETSRRQKVRQEAKQAWKKALERKDFAEARKQAMRSTHITTDVIESSKHLLELMGIPVLTAKDEGEALCALLVQKSMVYASASQDYDSLLFGCPRQVRNLSITGKKKRGNDYIIVNPEMLTLKTTLEQLGISQTQLIALGVLVGTDYNPGGVRGIGPKKALEVVKRSNSVDEIFQGIEWSFEYSPKEIFDFFKKHKDKYSDEEIAEMKQSIQLKEIDEEKLKDFLCDKHDFSPDRIDSALNKIKNTPKQSSLASWLGNNPEGVRKFKEKADKEGLWLK